jgi:hypothetical protein
MDRTRNSAQAPPAAFRRDGDSRAQAPAQPDRPTDGDGAGPSTGWDGIAELTDGISPDSVQELIAIRALETVYPLLHALAGRNLRDFLVRAAALEALVAADLPAFAPADLDRALYWLDDASRDATLRILRQSGWLEHEPGIGTTITGAGRWAYDILAFLHKRLGEAELLPSIAGLDYALTVGIDPVRLLQSMRSRLVALRAEIDSARNSHSEVVLRRTAGRIDDALSLSSQIRAALDRLPLDHLAARRVAREIHELLSQLHGAGAELHRDVVEVGRQYLALTGGLTCEQIVRSLMRRPLLELARVGAEALLPIAVPPPLLTTEVLASAAEQQALRVRPPAEEVSFAEPPDAPAAERGAGMPDEALTLLNDLGAIARRGEATPLTAFVPRGTAAESFLRLSLLALAGDARAGEGFAGQLGSLPVDVTVSNDGFPEPIEGQPLSALTPGELVPRSERGGGNHE